MKTVLIHGYVNEEVLAEVRKLMGGEFHLTECYQEGGYMLQLANDDREMTPFEADGYIGALYEAEEDEMPQFTGAPEDAPIFVGVPEGGPVTLMTEDDEEFEFAGGVWGADEDGTGKYQE
jgi:hypothetical protein